MNRPHVEIPITELSDVPHTRLSEPQDGLFLCVCCDLASYFVYYEADGMHRGIH